MIDMFEGYIIDWSAIAAFLAAGSAWFAVYKTSQTARGNWNSSLNLELVKLRERWIDSLRTLMAEYISEGMTKNEESTDRGEMKKFIALHSQILLMMDPEQDDRSKELIKNRKNNKLRSDYYFVPFSEIKEKMNETAIKWNKSQAIGAEMAELQIIFHRYLRHHWLALKEENIHDYFENF